MRLLPLLLLATACTTPRTEVVIGIATDIPAMQMDEVKINIFRDGVLAFDVPAWSVQGPNGGDYELPATFGVYSDDGSEPKIVVELHGTLHGAEVVLRRASFSLIKEQTLYMRMALVQACKNVWMSCEGGGDQTQSCIEGVCKPAAIDVHSFNTYFGGEEKFNYCQTATQLIDSVSGAHLTDPPSGTPIPMVCGTCVERACYK